MALHRMAAAAARRSEPGVERGCLALPAGGVKKASPLRGGFLLFNRGYGKQPETVISPALINHHFLKKWVDIIAANTTFKVTMR